MDKPKGGRGKRTEYSSEMIRIPEPIKDKVLALKEMFYNNELEAYEQKIVNYDSLLNEHQNLIASLSQDDKKLIASLEDAKKIARELIADNVKQKRSSRHLIAKLISSLFGEEVKPDDLLISTEKSSD